MQPQQPVALQSATITQQQQHHLFHSSVSASRIASVSISDAEPILPSSASTSFVMSMQYTSSYNKRDRFNSLTKPTPVTTKQAQQNHNGLIDLPTEIVSQLSQDQMKYFNTLKHENTKRMSELAHLQKYLALIQSSNPQPQLGGRSDLLSVKESESNVAVLTARVEDKRQLWQASEAAVKQSEFELEIMRNKKVSIEDQILKLKKEIADIKQVTYMYTFSQEKANVSTTQFIHRANEASRSSAQLQGELRLQKMNHNYGILNGGGEVDVESREEKQQKIDEIQAERDIISAETDQLRRVIASDGIKLAQLEEEAQRRHRRNQERVQLLRWTETLNVVDQVFCAKSSQPELLANVLDVKSLDEFQFIDSWREQNGQERDLNILVEEVLGKYNDFQGLHYALKNRIDAQQEKLIQLTTQFREMSEQLIAVSAAATATFTEESEVDGEYNNSADDETQSNFECRIPLIVRELFQFMYENVHRMMRLIQAIKMLIYQQLKVDMLEKQQQQQQSQIADRSVFWRLEETLKVLDYTAEKFILMSGESEIRSISRKVTGIRSVLEEVLTVDAIYSEADISDLCSAIKADDSIVLFCSLEEIRSCCKKLILKANKSSVLKVDEIHKHLRRIAEESQSNCFKYLFGEYQQILQLVDKVSDSMKLKLNIESQTESIIKLNKHIGIVPRNRISGTKLQQQQQQQQQQQSQSRLTRSISTGAAMMLAGQQNRRSTGHLRHFEEDRAERNYVKVERQLIKGKWQTSVLKLQKEKAAAEEEEADNNENNIKKVSTVAVARQVYLNSRGAPSSTLTYNNRHDLLEGMTVRKNISKLIKAAEQPINPMTTYHSKGFLPQLPTSKVIQKSSQSATATIASTTAQPSLISLRSNSISVNNNVGKIGRMNRSASVHSINGNVKNNEFSSHQIVPKYLQQQQQQSSYNNSNNVIIERDTSHEISSGETIPTATLENFEVSRESNQFQQVTKRAQKILESATAYSDFTQLLHRLNKKNNNANTSNDKDNNQVARNQQQQVQPP